jgi:CHAD domain-containing protein
MRATAEYERKLDAPVGFRLPSLGGQPLEPRLFTSVYYDVPGGSLAAAGITLRRRTEHGRSVWQLKLPAEDFRLELEEPGGPRPPEKVLQLLRAHLRHGPLERVAELRTRRSGELVARDGTRAEVTLDQVSIMEARRVRDKFVEVEVELRSGSPSQLDLLARELLEAGAEPGADVPKVFRAVGRRASPAAEPESPLEALRTRLGEQLREVEAHDPGTRLGRDPESLHDMRVAIRRIRALLRAGRRLLATDTRELEAQLKELGQTLGAVRDLDVLAEGLRAEAANLPDADRQALEALFTALKRERSVARRRLLRTLDSQAYLDLLDTTQRTIDGLRPSGEETTLDEVVARQAKKVRKLAKALPEQPSDEQLHELRKKGKRTRYAAELAGRKKVVRRAKRFQDVLGEHQDAVVAAQRLRELADGAHGEQAFAAGRLAERENARRQEARKAWPKAWKRLRKAL